MGVGAGLEVDVERASFRALPGLGKRLFLGVRVTGPLVIALAGEVTSPTNPARPANRFRPGAESPRAPQPKARPDPCRAGPRFAPRACRSACHCTNRIR